MRLFCKERFVLSLLIVFIGEGDSAIFNEEQFQKRCAVLKRCVGGNPELQLQVIYGIQVTLAQKQHPKGMQCVCMCGYISQWSSCFEKMHACCLSSESTAFAYVRIWSQITPAVGTVVTACISIVGLSKRIAEHKEANILKRDRKGTNIAICSSIIHLCIPGNMHGILLQ